MSMLIATAMSARATGKKRTSQHHGARRVLVPTGLTGAGARGRAALPHGPQTQFKRMGHQPDGRRFVGTEFQTAGPRARNPENASTKIIGQQPGDVTAMVNHLNLNPGSVNQVKGFGAPRKGRSAEVLLVIGEKAETTQTIRIVPTPLSYWICTTFPRERKYRAWFLKKHEGRPLLGVTKSWPAGSPRAWRMFRRFWKRSLAR